MGRTYPFGTQYVGQYEVPALPVDLSPFKIGATHVTVGMWREYLIANTALSMPIRPEWGWIDSHPMVNVSWGDIMGQDGYGGYAAWASRVAGVKLLLPSDAQWEYVAKVGKTQKYPWGNVYDDSKVWCSVEKSRFGTAAVDRSTNVYANDFGVSDLCSNVLEWCLDGDYLYAKSYDRLGYETVSRDPVHDQCNFKCIRGSSWGSNNPDLLRCVNRNVALPLHSIHVNVLGFRLSAGLG